MHGRWGGCRKRAFRKRDASPPFQKEERMDKTAYASFEDVSRLVQDMGDGEVIRIIFEEADDVEGRDS